MRRLILAAVASLVPGAAVAQDCTPFAAPVLDLAFKSRYAQDDATRSELDPVRAAAAEAALGPLDDFVSDMTARTDEAIASGDRQAAACVLAELAHWARADSLSDLGTQTVELTISSRLAGLALVAGQVGPAGDSSDFADVSAWLSRRMDAQMVFWETAPDGAAQGNLRAWAALAGAAVALVTDDAVTRGWAAWSVSYVGCTAAPDGSLPQEMRRGELALHYQLHAVAPLVVAAALLDRQGVSVMDKCGRALDRVVGFTLRDVAAGGAESAALAGVPQSVAGGLEALDDFQLSWGEAWLQLRSDAALEQVISARRPLRYSKLGGDQTRIWSGGR
ncbi:MAG: alginate lyase family protein [Pseudomonadota bacterium]